MTTYILTLSCKDARGIVAAVAGFISAQDGFIIESAQFGDASTDQFFLRMEFSTGPRTPAEPALKAAFDFDVGTKYAMDWKLHNKAVKPKVLLCVSGLGHCLNDLLYRVETDQLAVEIPAIVSNHAVLKPVADRHGIPFFHFPMDVGKPKQEAQIMEVVEKTKSDVVVLARYMQILSEGMCQQLEGRAINIHHSFLPSFKGAKPYEQAFNRGVKLIGATAHYVTSELDEGPIIEQEVSRVDHSLGPDELAAIGRDIECLVLARALKYHTEHRVLLNDHKTVVFR